MEVQCCHCQNIQNYARECYFNKESNENDKGVTQFVHVGGSGSEKVILMIDTQLAQDKTNVYYIHIRCNNHMVENKNWFIKLDESTRRSIGFVDNIMVT